ncbi:Ankyrin repeat [Aphanomyces cochlioides]|nr:Ankyrin repeat [Aphanomyces cochlioides]
MEQGQSIHPLAIGVGILGLIILVLVVTASSHQRERLQYMAKKAFRSKRVENTSSNVDYAPGALPSFAKAAAETGNTRMLQRWVSSHGPDINARSAENMTALHYAARGGHTECMRILLEAGANANVEDERHVTPLHLASVGGFGLGVKLLLDHKADPFVEDADQNTALSAAEAGGNVGCARLLQRAMAKAAVADGGAPSLTLRGSQGPDNQV